MAGIGSHSYFVKSGTPFVELTIIEKARKGAGRDLPTWNYLVRNLVHIAVAPLRSATPKASKQMGGMVVIDGNKHSLTGM